MRLALTAILVLALAAACASPGMPPGGPTTSAFPRVIATRPDTGAVNTTPGRVFFRYDDVIGEQANGGDLVRSVLISPWDGEPRVEWKRTGMTVRPRNGWRPNTAYTITILPGIADFRGKGSPFGYVYRFSTGPTIPKTVIRGVTFDWLQARFLPKATVQAINPKDTTLVWLTVSDSTGRFEFGSMPPGQYIIRGIDERSPNRILDSREPWDTATVTVTDSARTDLYVFIHDTLPVRISELRLSDSVTIRLTLDKPLQQGVDLPANVARVVLTDSTVLQVASAITSEQDRFERARADSIARLRDTTAAGAARRDTTPRRTIDPTRRRDTTPVLPPPTTARAAPTTELVVKMTAPLKQGSTYRVTLTGLRNLLGVSGTTTRLLIVPKATPPDSTRTGRDSTGRPIPPRDSTTRAPVPVRPPARPPR